MNDHENPWVNDCENPHATVQSNFVSTMTAPRQGSFANGFVVLNCSQPVQASLTYFYWAADGHLIGMATVLSARAILSSALTVYDFLGRYGIAIANPGSTTLSLTIQLDTATSSIQRQVSLLPNSQIVGFADELLNISPTIGQAAVLTIRSNSQDRFYTTGLLFNGSAFTTLVPGADVAATPTGGSTSSDPCAALAGASIVASDGQFLGKISSDRYNSQSISNQFGNYGSPFSSTSIFNSVGTYGSTVSSKSAFNEVASTPPVVIGANGQSLGFLTVNSVKTPGINTWTVVACVQPSRDAL